VRSHVRDDEGVAKLCERELGRLIGYLLNCGVERCDVPDIVQDTLVVVCEKGDEVTAHPNPTAYLYRTARGKARDRYRSNKSRTENEIRWHQQCPPLPLPEPDLVGLAIDVQRGLAQLAPRQREVVYLHRCADIAIHDVAGVLGIEPRTAKTHLSRGERRLRVLLSEKNTGDPS
jgi:RNA polymerase sigma-70 factor, ECF subfamily